jgi:two-component system osmolarity sensor histidine kinase EnvZ
MMNPQQGSLPTMPSGPAPTSHPTDEPRVRSGLPSGGPVRCAWRRLDSLFLRLLLAQLLTVALMLLLVSVLFMADRNRVMTDLYADHWAPVLASASGRVALLEPAPAVLRSDEQPAGTSLVVSDGPRITALREALARRGIPVDRVAVASGPPGPMTWLHTAQADGPPVWLGVAGRLVVSDWPVRVSLALALGVALLVAASYGFTRWLTRPLEQLRTRMQAQAPGAPPVPAAAQRGSGMAPEIEQIGLAFADLQARQARFERERAMLLAGVSHDLRSPLGRIRMAAEFLPDGPATAPRREAIVRNVKACDRLIESFLDFVRSGELTFDETVDLAAAARTAASGFERPPGELIMQAPAMLLWPAGNRLLFERLVANLVDNAFKHGRTPVRVRLGTDARSAWLEVEDAGAGLPPEAGPRVQEAFVRGDASRATPGTGLGLAVVRQVAQRLGGEVSFVREPGSHRVRVTLARPV